MRRVLWIAVILAGCAPAAVPPGVPRPEGPTPAARADPWFGEDKLRHLVMSFAAANFAYAAARTAGLERDAALPVALGAGAAAGLGKELDDRRRGRRLSVRDLVWDAAGLAASALLLRELR